VLISGDVLNFGMKYCLPFFQLKLNFHPVQVFEVVLINFKTKKELEKQLKVILCFIRFS